MAMKGIARQNDTIRAQELYRARKRLGDALESRIADHGADGLCDWLVEKGYDLADNTVKTSSLLAIRRLLGEDVRRAALDVLPCF